MKQPTPERQPDIICNACGTPNDPARGAGRCVNCNEWL